MLTSSCGETKIDGIAHDINGNNPVLVIELAESVKTHSKEKLRSDTLEIYRSCIDIMENSSGQSTNTDALLSFSKWHHQKRVNG